MAEVTKYHVVGSITGAIGGFFASLKGVQEWIFDFIPYLATIPF